ncbi:MAG: phytanoyl-CoA dioxygenase family protein [Planctomycetes bacterium]|nr:phytanoyl-CoA dioxygenase family protein [Planctomycetota bacterium]
MAGKYKITEEHYQQLLEDGYIILRGYISDEELPALQAAQRRVLKTWDQVKENPPADGSAFVPYPPPDVTMAKLYLDPQLIALGRRYLKTPDIVARVGYMLARYPGFKSGDTGHIDNGNNSLLPMTETHREFGQIGFWIHLDEVTEEQAPLLLVKKKYGRSLEHAEPVVGPPGTIAVFGNYAWHASSPFKGKEGQRFTWGLGLGRADHIWEGLIHYTSIGQNEIFRQVISSLTPEERTLFRFPKPGHHYYTKQTLAALEAQYPGFNASGAYYPAD